MIYPALNKLNSIYSLLPWSLLGLMFSIPMSVSLSCIFWITVLIIILITPAYRHLLPVILKSPVAISSIAFFIFICVACLWSDALLSEKLIIVEKYSKFLFFPLLIAAFSQKNLRYQTLHAFLAIMTLTALLSLLKWTGIEFIHWKNGDPDQVFYNHIMTSLMMAYAAYTSAWFFWRSTLPEVTTCAFEGVATQDLGSVENKDVRSDKSACRYLGQSIYALLFILFTFQLFFISSGRTGYILYSLLVCLFLWQTLPLKKALIAISISGIFLGIICCQSPVVQQGIENIIHDKIAYQQHDLQTSLGYRLQFHAFSKKLFEEHYLIGNGTAGFWHAYQRDNPIPSWISKHPEPHGQYWLFLSEFGLLGFFIFALFLCALLYEIWQLKEMQLLAIGIFAIFLVGNFTDSFFYYSTTLLFFMIIIAICLSEKYDTTSL